MAFSGSLEVSRDEFLTRQRRAVEVAHDRGLAALLVVSRMGTDMYWYGDVLYFTGHHSGVGDFGATPFWTGRGHSYLILPVDRDPVLVVDLPDPPAESVHVDDVRFALHVPQAVAKALAELGLDRERLGLVGVETLKASARDIIEQELGKKLEIEPADDIADGLRMIKSERELDLMRNASAVGSEAMNIMMDAAKPGATEGQIVGEGLRHLAANSGYLYDIAITSGPAAAHYWNPKGPPHWDSARRLKLGDTIHIDLWGPVRGYYTDFARTTVVGEEPTDLQTEVIEAAIASVEHVMDGMRPGIPIGDVYARGRTWLQDNGWLGEGTDERALDAGLHSYCPIFGHGIGLSVENPWIVAGETIPLVEGMTFAVEQMLVRDGVGANFEHDVVVGAEGLEVLDAACPARWTPEKVR